MDLNNRLIHKPLILINDEYREMTDEEYKAAKLVELEVARQCHAEDNECTDEINLE